MQNNEQNVGQASVSQPIAKPDVGCSLSPSEDVPVIIHAPAFYHQSPNIFFPMEYNPEHQVFHLKKVE